MAGGTDLIRPPGWPRPSGYADGVSARGRVLFLSGQIGWDPLTHTLAGDTLVVQVRRALMNVLEILKTAGGWPDQVVRMTWYVTDRDAYLGARRELGAIWRELFGSHYPAMTVVAVSALLEEGALVEIEATAVLPDG